MEGDSNDSSEKKLTSADIIAHTRKILRFYEEAKAERQKKEEEKRLAREAKEQEKRLAREAERAARGQK